MTMTPPAAPKVCISCGQDCSDKPSSRDQHGWYLCKECIEAGAPHKPVRGARNLAPPLPDSPPQKDDAPIPLAPVDDPPPAPSPAATKGSRPRTKSGPCPACSVTMPAGALVCINCGFDQRKGFQKGSGVGATKSRAGELCCPDCGYDLRGLTTSTCPECGETISPERARIARRDREQRAMYAQAYIIPGVMLVVGLGLTCWRVHASGISVPAFLLCFAIEAALSMGVYVVCGLWWIGFAAPLPLAALQLTGCLAAMEAGRWIGMSVLAGVPIGVNGLVVGYGLLMILTAGVMKTIMDMDWEDASFVCTGISIVGVFTWPLMQLLGWV